MTFLTLYGVMYSMCVWVINDMKTMEYINPRQDANERFPKWSQHLITIISNKPTIQELDIIEGSSITRVWSNVCKLFIATSLTIITTVSFTPWNVPITILSILFAVGILRDFHLSIAHEATHYNFFSSEQKRKIGKKWRFWNQFILELATTLCLSNGGDEYRDIHKSHHMRSIFMTPDDPDAKF